MKIKRLLLKGGKDDKKLNNEDMRYLQKKISGRSVYKNLSSLYKRNPKHKNEGHQNQD